MNLSSLGAARQPWKREQCKNQCVIMGGGGALVFTGENDVCSKTNKKGTFLSEQCEYLLRMSKTAKIGEKGTFMITLSGNNLLGLDKSCPKLVKMV